MDETTQTTPTNKEAQETDQAPLTDEEALKIIQNPSAASPPPDEETEYPPIAQVAPALVTPELVQRLAAKYETPLQAVIRPEVVMGVPRYFLDRWVPVLGPSQATLVNTLRQLAYHAPKEPVVRSGAALAAEASMSRRHLYKCLKSPWVRVFVQVESGKKIKREGRTTRHPNRYTVRSEDPLTPADAQQLFTQLRQFAQTPIEAMRKALEKKPRQLWAASPLTPPQTRFAKPKPLFAEEVVRRAFPRWQPANEDERIIYNVLTDLLHKHLTLVRDDGRVSKVIVPQYFRKHWWPLLGHDLAWIYLWLRGRTYENEEQGIVRASYWVPSLNTLLEIIGRPREWWRRHVDRDENRAKGWQVNEFFSQTQTQKGRNPKYPQRVARLFTVNIIIPVAPENLAYYTDLTLYWPPPPEPIEVAPAKPQAKPTAAAPTSAEASAVPTQAAPTSAEVPAAPASAEVAAPSTPSNSQPSPPPPQEQQEQPPAPIVPVAPVAPQQPVLTYEERLRKAIAAVRGKSKPIWDDGDIADDEVGDQSSYEDTTSHMRTQSQEGLPHLDTISDGISATSVHNAPPTSDTTVHNALPRPRTGFKNLRKAPSEESHFSSSSYRGDPPTPEGSEYIAEGAAAKNNDFDIEEITLPELLNRALRKNPQQPLYQIATLRIWLEQGPRLPVTPHTPAWTHTFSGRISRPEAVALILAVRADPSLRNEARHLSWLSNQYLLRHGQPPVNAWRQFQKMARMPIGEWPSAGRRLWVQYCKYPYKNMPWHLDDIFRQAVLDGVIPHPETPYALPRYRYRWEEEDDDQPYDGLDERPGKGPHNAYNVWRIASSHIRLDIGDELHAKWFADCEAVFYDKEEKKLLVCAPDTETIEVLKTQFGERIEKAVNGAAMGELSVVFVLEIKDPPPEAADETGQGGEAVADTNADAPSAPDSN